MENSIKKEVIISLIRDDLIHEQLTGRLALAGMQTHEYCLNLGETIFTLAGVEADETRYETYLGLSKQAVNITPGETSPELNLLAEEIYREVFAG